VKQLGKTASDDVNRVTENPTCPSYHEWYFLFILREWI